jgi:hypothetical protein
MRGTDAYSEALFSTVRLKDLVPAKHPLRSIPQWVNDALAKMYAKFSAMYEADSHRPRRLALPPDTPPHASFQSLALKEVVGTHEECYQRISAAHLHCLMLDGVYRCDADGTVDFIEAGAPTDGELHALLQTVIVSVINKFDGPVIKLGDGP